MIKIKHFFFMFFLCLLLLISTRAIKTSKDGNQFGVTKESRTKIRTDGWRDWGGSFPDVEKENSGGGDKEGGQGKSAKEKGEVHESVTEGWRDWGGAFPDVE